MSDSTQMDDGQLNNNDGFDAMDDAIGSLLDNAVENGTLAPAYDEEEESTQSDEEITEELESEDNTEEDAVEVDEEEEDATDDTEEDEDDDKSTQNSEADEEDDGEIDMEFMVPVKVDGEESEISMEDLIKGYQTNQSQTKKGQELAEQTKELEQAREQNGIYQKINNKLLQQQDEKDLALLQSRKDIMDKVAAGDYVEGVEDDLATLKYQYDGLQEEYDKRKASRDSLSGEMTEAYQKEVEEDMGKRIELFQSEIVNHIPDWSPEVAQDNYKFAVENGIPEEIVASITDPSIAKFVDEFRRLKTSTDKGAIKRKKASVKKIPTKKNVSSKTKQKSKSVEARSRLSKGKGTKGDLDTLNNDIYDNIFEDSKLF